MDQGADWSEVWTWNDAAGLPVNLTGCHARMSWRAEDGTPVLSVADGAGITLGGAAGTITPAATAAQTALIAGGVYGWDLYVTFPGGRVDCPLAGLVRVRARVTP